MENSELNEIVQQRAKSSGYSKQSSKFYGHKGLFSKKQKIVSTIKHEQEDTFEMNDVSGQQ